MTLKQVAEKYNIKLAKDVILEDVVAELLIRVKNLEVDMKALMGHKETQEEIDNYISNILNSVYGE